MIKDELSRSERTGVVIGSSTSATNVQTLQSVRRTFITVHKS